MRTNKCTLLCDGNWLLLSRFSVIGKGFEMDMPVIAKETAQKELEELMAKSISIILNRFPIIDNVILVTDGGSWRKQLAVPKSLKDTTYKGNRQQAKEHDWTYIYGALSNLSETCKSLGMTVSNHSSIEGDDWIWYWSRRLNADGISTIIWSSDNDLKQLLQTNANCSFTAWYNDRNGVWFDDSHNEEIVDELEFFMQPIKVESPIVESLKQFSRSTSYMKPDSIIMEKIICGDAGDNIKSVAKVLKGKKTYKVSPKMWEEIRISLNINTIKDFIDNKENIANQIISIPKFAESIYNEVLEMIEYNIKLVWLNEAVIPETIIMYMNQLEYKLIDVNYIKSNYKTLCKKHDDVEDVFEEIEDLF